MFFGRYQVQVRQMFFSLSSPTTQNEFSGIIQETHAT